jgi:hypothetical protein
MSQSPLSNESFKQTVSRAQSLRRFAVGALTLFVLSLGALALVRVLKMASSALERAQADRARPRYTVLRAQDSLRIDGVLDEESWRYAASTGAFRLSKEGTRAENFTEAKLLWDDEYLYVAFHCADAHIVASKTERDDKLWEEEAVELFFAPNAPERFGYAEIEISPANAILDLYVREAPQFVPVALPYHTYNLDIRSAVRLKGTLNDSSQADTSWTVELAIPLRDIQLVGAPPIQDGDEWAMNLYRIERFPRLELTAWSPTGRNKFHIPERFGVIAFSRRSVLANKK